jgi:predicted CXXCH cytochrome family protein
MGIKPTESEVIAHKKLGPVSTRNTTAEGRIFMRGVKFGLVIFAACLFTLALGGLAYAFHSGGVAECGGCHSMHAPKAGGSFLLIGADPSSTCLSCHQQAGLLTPSSYHISTADADMGTGVPPRQRTPGGDFGWLKKTYTFTARSGATPTTEAGDTHGHNIVAADFGYVADATNVTAPGGTFASSQLGCDSCHDPHGQTRRLSDGTLVNGSVLGQKTSPIIGSGSYNNSATPVGDQAIGVYRLLRGGGDTSIPGANFTASVIAVAPSTYNQTEATNQVRVAYGASGINTWGNWCATCHPNMHSSGNYVHPVDQSLGSGVANIYNAYVKSGDLTGNAATSFLSLVPFAENTNDLPTLRSHASNTNGYLNGPGSSDKVMCLSCHRAHASGFPEMLRWQMEGEFITYNGAWPGTDTTPTVPQFSRGRLGAETQAAYYDRLPTTFATYQRVLCNKCHAKD